LFAFKLSYNDAVSATKLYNGNISETFWKTNSDNVIRKYNYTYDNLNRLLDASYSKPGVSTFNSYKEALTYDKNGNITSLLRHGSIDTDGSSPVNPIDNLAYSYDPAKKNQLLKVFDSTNSPQGFKDDTTGTSDPVDDYTYDANGNMKTDTNKGITAINYNHLNLPTKLFFGSNTIEYLYNATGQKLQKKVIEGATTTITHYLSGFQYKNDVLQFFPHAEGYVNFESGAANYVFNYTDHLGNVRLSYAKDNITGSLKVVEENNYYAFGLKHSGYNNTVTSTNPGQKYKFGGNEFQDELGLNVYDYDNRVYDQAVGRFWQMDPLGEQGRRWSSYNYCFDNPVYFQDPDGMWPWPTWSQVKSFASGVGQGAVGYAKSVASTVSNAPARLAQGYSSPREALKLAVESHPINLVVSQFKPAVDAVKSALNGDAKGVGKAYGAHLAAGATILATDGAVKALGKPSISAETSPISSLSSSVKTAANELNASGRAPATVVGAELNGQTTIATSGAPPTNIASQLNSVVGELGGVGTKTASGNTVGCCAEFQAGNKLLLENPSATPQQINFTDAIRPRTGQVVPMCENCQTTFGKK
jgi:RHS repeat-associated protein